MDTIASQISSSVGQELGPGRQQHRETARPFNASQEEMSEAEVTDRQNLTTPFS
jgi:hypothetical protein